MAPPVSVTSLRERAREVGPVSSEITEGLAEGAPGTDAKYMGREVSDQKEVISLKRVCILNLRRSPGSTPSGLVKV